MHPGDFTPVCTTELGEAQKNKAEMDKRNVKMCGFSCNDAESHRGWIEDIKVATGCGEFDVPMFCDPNREHAVKLGVLDESNKDAMGLPLTVRAAYILKPDKSIALIMYYPASTGRNYDEILRVIDSLQLTVTAKLATPVNWTKGKDALVNFPLSDSDADDTFGKDGYKITEVPSEQGKDLAKHYLRWVPTASA
jgi:1-Cys peroxiredoxin 6